MFATFKQIFRSSNKDLRFRVLFTLGALIIFALGNSIVLPTIVSRLGDIDKLDYLDLFNALSGGGLKQYSIFALGVMPYISASIVIQILQMDIIPYFKELKEMGEEGRRKVAKITRYLGLSVAFIQGFFYPMMLLGNTINLITCLKSAIILAGGTAFLLWLGDEITNKGIGNGVSLIIMAGIVNSLPSMFKTAYTSLIPNANNALVAWITFAIFILLYLVIIVGIIWVENAERRIPIQYSNRSSGSYGGQQTFLPLKLNSASVMPVIIASVIMGIPSIVSNFVKNGKVLAFMNNYLSTSKPVGFILFIVLIIAFTYIYTFLTINPDELSKNLNKNGGYIPGVRPGKETKDYISKVLSRITFMGALFIALLAALPYIFTLITGLPDSVKLGGTSILIAVGVILETYKQLESSVASRNYNRR